MQKINFYIGSNNKTGELEKDKAIEVLSSFYEGMNISELVGVWQGVRENSLLVSVVCEQADYTTIRTVCRKLNLTLDQQAIMVEVVESNALFISDR